MASAQEGNKSASYPLYHKMILAAISRLGEERSSKSDISAYIETTYRDNLPENHEAVLSYTLEKMKEAGELSLYKNNYVQPDASSAARRGRGRPPKTKQPLPPGVDPPTPRPRGRPPKPKDPLTTAVTKASHGLPRRRGRPPSKHRPSVGDSPAKPKTAAVKPSVAGVKRGRGRPPKLRQPAADVAVE
ncbi:hypothetical protein KSP40_PGU013966 [Platanthera guangdongensis]|uniref:H15 domain-containing protein n=1 Tax=Platanthera guangdongensis TaxID=2320717 RepID=A0ABR2M6E0_9ASPA